MLQAPHLKLGQEDYRMGDRWESHKLINVHHRETPTCQWVLHSQLEQDQDPQVTGHSSSQMYKSR